MNTVPIDRNILNSLFDNQNKLDELFDSIFDDDNYLINSTPSSSQVENYYPVCDVESQPSYSSNNLKKSLLAIKHNPLYYVLPIVLEIAVIYLAVINLL